MDTTSTGDTADVKYTLFGTKGNGNEQFDTPLGMAFNHDKTEIFVADSSNNRVQVLSYNREKGELTFKHTISNKTDDTGRNIGTLNKPSGVASGIDNTKPVILVADTDNHNVCWFNDGGSNHYIGKLDTNKPCSVAVDKDGTFFAYDNTNCRIEIIMNDGTTKYICDKGEGTDDGQLGHWGTLAFDNDDNLVVADEDNNRVQVLNRSNGKHIRTITGNHGVRSGQLKAPCGIAFTDDGEHIIIADTGNNRVCVLTYPDGVIVNSFGGTKGTNLGEFDGPYGVLVDDENKRIIVSEDKNHRIQVIHNALPPKKLAKVEGNPSKSKYPNLEIAIRNAISAFSTSLGSGDAYADILNQLNEKIDEDRKRISNPDLLLSELLKKVTKVTRVSKVLKGKTTEVKKAEPESELKSKTEVTNFISSQKDAIFVVTGGSFNPPHNGHIGMFQKAYDALMKVVTNKGKTVYGVMVPASDDWIEKKLCKEVTPATKSTGRNCNDTEFTAEPSKAAIESKRIQVTERVNLCKLSCDSYAWTSDPTNFNASNMIVVNESGDGEEFTSAKNTYYLCGSDYYQESDTKFICVLRKGDKREGTNLVKKDGKTEGVPIKDGDIIIDDDGVDNDASSTMLRNILTTIRDTDEYDATDPVSKNLLTKQVYCELLKMKYIVGDKGKDVADFLKCGELDLRDTDDTHDSDDTDTDDKDIIPMKLTGNKDDPNKDKFIKDLVDSFDKWNAGIKDSAHKSDFTSETVKDALDNVYNHGHYMLLNDIHFMNKKTSGQPLIFQLMNKNHLLTYFANQKFDIDGDKVYDSYKTEFGKLSDRLRPEYEALCKFLFETERTAILFQILRNGEERIFAGIMKGFYDDLLTKEGNARDAILAAVGYIFKSAYGDGNCFYNSAGMQLIGSVVDYKVYDKLDRNNEWQRTQFEKQTTLRTALADYLKKLYTNLQSHSNFATSENITIKYLRTNGPDFQTVSTILTGIGSRYWGTDDELYFIAALYGCFIVILPSNDTNFQTIEYTEKIDSDSDQAELFKALSEPSIPVLSPDVLITKLAEVKATAKQIIFMLGGKGHWDYAIPTK